MNDSNLHKRLSELESKWLDGSITPEEAKEYMDWYNEDDASPVIVPKELGINEQEHNANLFASIKSKIQVPIKRLPISRLYKTTIQRWVAAASILIVFGTGAYLWFDGIKKIEQPLVSKSRPLVGDIAPGRDQAILTMDNGRQIVLDSAQKNIVQRGDLKVINLNGRLDYEGVGSSAEYHTLSTPKGGQYKLALPDGTNVWLNAASSIRYPTLFDEEERKVTITGEAYFEVSKDAKRKFLVTAGSSVTEVLGTHFNINAYGDKPRIEVTLLEGSVKVNNSHAVQFLKPGQQAHLSFDGSIAVNKNVDTEGVIAWKNGFFKFNNEDLEIIMKQIRRWYDVDVVYEGKMRPISFGGIISRKENVSAALELLELTGAIKFRIEQFNNNNTNKIIVKM